MPPWFKDSASELNDLFILIGIAILWQSTERSFDYTYKKLDTKMPHEDFISGCGSVVVKYTFNDCVSEECTSALTNEEDSIDTSDDNQEKGAVLPLIYKTTTSKTQSFNVEALNKKYIFAIFNIFHFTESLKLKFS